MDEVKKENFDSSLPSITHGENRNMTEKIRKNPWIVSSFILGAIILVFVVGNIFGLTGNLSLTGKSVSGSTAGESLITYLNTIADSEVKFVSVKESNGLYLVTVEYNGENIPIYTTKDGQYYTTTLVPLTASSSQPNAQPAENLPKTDKPKVELFVMSFCPYGVKAENNIFSIVNLFKDKVDFKIRFIANVAGTTIDSVSSLHGLYEAKEDARQAVIMKNYPDKFYSYLKEINDKCYPIARDEAQLDICWKNAASSLGMDTAKIETAAYGKEGIDLLKADEAITSQYGISGSPTLLINGVQSSSIYAGTSAVQSAICSAFSSAPSECGTQLSDSSSSETPAGSC